jgi:hypothetical protein
MREAWGLLDTASIPLQGALARCEVSVAMVTPCVSLLM